MTGSSFWQEFESGGHPLLKLVRFVVIVGGLAFLVFTGILQLSWPQQLILDALIVPLAIWMDRSSSSYLVTLTMMLVSMFSTLRYGYWRLATTAHFFTDPNVTWTALDAFFISFSSSRRSIPSSSSSSAISRPSGPFAAPPFRCPTTPRTGPPSTSSSPPTTRPFPSFATPLSPPSISTGPPTSSTSTSSTTASAPSSAPFAEESGVGYMTRDDNKHAKAGNINRALAKLDSPFVCIFDCDHVPTRSFLQVTIGWFLRDQKLGMLQTPHHFYSPDPFERNLHQFRTIPNEGELFYGIVQDGNDFWNATFFCGSCAVLRRTALDEIGGIAVETVTEDAHTSLRMQMNGWNTAYINIPQAAGPRHRAPLRPRQAAHPLGARHDPDHAHRQPALRPRPQARAAPLLLQRNVALPLRLSRASSFSPPRSSISCSARPTSPATGPPSSPTPFPTSSSPT